MTRKQKLPGSGVIGVCGDVPWEVWGNALCIIVPENIGLKRECKIPGKRT